MKYNKELIDSVYSKRTEIHYNEWYIRPAENIKLELKGKIKCPLFNMNISSTVCVTLMDNEGWPRCIDQSVCSKCGCFINRSISRYKTQNKKDNYEQTTK